MINLDKIKQQKIDTLNKLSQAIRDNDEKAMQQAFDEYQNLIAETILAEAHGVLASADNTILTQRGSRMLTSKETEYYQKLISAASSSNPKQSIANIDIALPQTVIDSVLEDITLQYPLLNLIDFTNTTAITKMIVNEQGIQQAAWGKLTSEITKELEASIAEYNTALCKLTAYMFVAKDMLELGPVWIDKYVRNILQEAIATALETSIVSGNGKDQPIGMIKDVSKDTSVVDGVYPDKTTISVTNFAPDKYGELVAKLTKTPTDRTRVIENLVLICNPTDYYTKVMPATTYMTADKRYVNDVLPVPTIIVQSTGVEKGKAVLGLAKRYFMGMGTSKEGRIEYDDSYKFLEDLRTFSIKLFGNGKPLDNNAFLYLDISKLKPVIPTVKTVTETEA